MWEKVLNLFNYIGDHSGCHQIPERCFKIKGYTFPLCARCTGILIGQILACIVIMCGVTVPFGISLAMFGIMGIDGSVQHFGIKESTNTRRFLTGFLGGFGFIVIVVKIIAYIIKLVLRML